ncbi:Flap-structured DNA-binding and RNA-binding protein [Arthrobotrys conoides]|uniref:RNA-binding protein VTS1 n=1 Tax=Arthrobotrys conoides TaxID=74498 RepID=A0AAN8RR10_9PEZI
MATNRNSTPDGSASSLRPPTNRGHHLRASADMSGFTSPLANSRQIRPASEVYLNAGTPPAQGSEAEAYDKAAQKWLADLESYENTLDEMAAATLDQEFKDELSAIEQWFRVLSAAERTAALYALLQQTSPVQVRFFIAILQQMASSQSDPLSNRMSELMVGEQSRHSFPSRPPPSPTTLTNRNSQLDPATVSAMFPEAAAALATQRARYSQVSGVTPGTKSNRNSAIFETKPSSSLSTMTLANNPPASPWRRDESVPQPSANGNENRPKSGQDNKPAATKESMGNWQAPPRSAGIRSPGIPTTGASNLQTTTITSVNGGNGNVEMPELSPFPPGANWASMVNTPVVPMFGNDAMSAQANADMVANATAMKLAAMSTVNNRFLIDSDVRKYRRSKPDAASILSPGLPPNQQQIPAITQNVIMYNERGQPVQIPAAAVQIAAAQQQLAGQPSPGLQSATYAHLTSPQNNGFLTPTYGSPLLSGPTLSLNQFVNAGSEGGYHSDHSDLTGRGRSPRGGRRGSSKPPEDPTDITLLNDIPAWLRSLRLHKYTDNLKDLKWQELVLLDDEALEKRGVAAVGARRKMLKVFEQVRDAKTDGKLPA